MNITIKKIPEKKGMLGGRVFLLEMWLDLTKKEKAAIKSSALTQMLLEVKKDAYDKPHQIILKDFLRNSGPKTIPFLDAFAARDAGDEFKSSVETTASLVKSYIAGDVTRDESFEL
jgi:hypothetical protein